MSKPKLRAEFTIDFLDFFYHFKDELGSNVKDEFLCDYECNNDSVVYFDFDLRFASEKSKVWKEKIITVLHREYPELISSDGITFRVSW